MVGRLRRIIPKGNKALMRPIRYSINITLDGCVDHRSGLPDEELHRYWAERLTQSDALLFGRITYKMMEDAWRPSALGGWPDCDGRLDETFRRHY